jgi:hypothetical protein
MQAESLCWQRHCGEAQQLKLIFPLLWLRPKRSLKSKLFDSETRQYPFAIKPAVCCRLVYAGRKFVLADTAVKQSDNKTLIF